MHECSKEVDFKNIWEAISSLKNSVAWKLGFWIMVVFFTIAVPSLIAAVVNNDRLRASEDLRIESSARKQFDILIDRINVMSGDIREIKTILKSEMR